MIVKLMYNNGFGDAFINAENPSAVFDSFEELEEFLQNVELNDGYQLIILRRETSNEINIYRHKD